MYGSGAPLWGQGESTGQPSNSSKYQAPKLGDGNSYQEEQNYIVRDSLKTNYDADGTAAALSRWAVCLSSPLAAGQR